MTLFKKMRYLAFLTVVVAGLAPAPAYAYPPCSDGYCNDCPNGPGYYWDNFGGSCCGCEFITWCEFNGGVYYQCYCGSAC